MRLKPLVERLEAELGSQGKVIRVSIHEQAGQDLMQQYGLDSVPQFIVFNSAGKEIWRGGDVPTVAQVLAP
jgi:thioredoxin-like negative regulator of GroEL